MMARLETQDRTPDDAAIWQARFHRLNQLYQLGNQVYATLNAEEALALLMREAVRLTKASSGSVVLVNPTTGFLEIQAAWGLPRKAHRIKLRVGEGVTGWVARSGKSLRLDDVRQDSRYIMLRRSVRSELAVPLYVDGNLSGVLNVDSTRLDAFDDDDQSLLEEIAGLAARVIHNTWRFEQLRLKTRLFESLASVSQAISSPLGVDEVLQVITREACQLMNARMCSLLLLDDSREWLDLRASHGAGPAYIAKPRLSVSDSLLGVVVRRQKPLQIENVQISSRYQSVEIARSEGLVSLLSAPLVFNGQSIGVLGVYTGQPHSFSNEEIRILAAMASLSAVAIEKARLYERVVEMEDQLRKSEKLSALGLLAAEVAHEIRNPLTVMKMLHHSLNLSFAANDPRGRDFALLGEKMDHLNRIVERILDFARNTEPCLKPLNINHILEELVLLVRHKLSQQKIEMCRELSMGLPPVLGDATQLEQAFLNLILNAVQAMPEGGRLMIRSRADPSPGDDSRAAHVLIEFKDTGLGLSEEQCRHLGGSILNTTKRTGTGLGLAIVVKTIEAHGGKITAKSRAGQGTLFSIHLPVAQESIG
ncbi:MAG TPA: GAF domain-containing protein [Verrucomicrobiota bacterium]|nr:GAF domain-containing protein [Verrucomicrobiota bacterium]